MSIHPRISVIIPAFNEELVIEHTLKRLVKDLTDASLEFIVVADGCTDGTVRKALSVDDKRIKVLSYRINHGKGYAIQHGVRHAKGEVMVFYDAGGDYSPDHVTRYADLLSQSNASIITGDKQHSKSIVHYPRRRRVMSFCYRAMVKLLFRLPVEDTQTGLKAMTRDAVEQIFPRLIVQQYAFDLELLTVANLLNNKIVEAPVNLEYNSLSSHVTLRTITKIIIDTMMIFYRKVIIKWYSRPAAVYGRISMAREL